jgi:hypothetical protein
MSPKQASLLQWCTTGRRSPTEEERLVRNQTQGHQSINNRRNQQRNRSTNTNPRNHNHQLIQQSLTEGNTNIVANEHWGHPLGDKHTGTVCIAFRNINYLPQYSKAIKNEELLYDIQQASIDILGLSETNVA